MTAQLWVTVIVAVIAGLGGVAAMFKLRGENTRIFVSAAEGAVVVQSGVIDDLREQLESLRTRMASYEVQIKEAEQRALVAEKQVKIAEHKANLLELERDAVLRANVDLNERVLHLEDKVDELENRRDGNLRTRHDDEGNDDDSDTALGY